MSPSDLAAAIDRGDRAALSKAITLVESTRADHRKQAQELLLELGSLGRKFADLRIALGNVRVQLRYQLLAFFQLLSIGLFRLGNDPLRKRLKRLDDFISYRCEITFGPDNRDTSDLPFS